MSSSGSDKERSGGPFVEALTDGFVGERAAAFAEAPTECDALVAEASLAPPVLIHPVWLYLGAVVIGFIGVFLAVFQGQFLWVAYKHGGL